MLKETHTTAIRPNKELGNAMIYSIYGMDERTFTDKANL